MFYVESPEHKNKEEENKNYLESHHLKINTVEYCSGKTPKFFSVIWMDLYMSE